MDFRYPNKDAVLFPQQHIKVTFGKAIIENAKGDDGMTSNEYKHKDLDCCHGKTLSLHDCVAKSVSFTNGVLRFYLPDGFWITPQHTENNLNKTVRTDASTVSFSAVDIDEIKVRVFTRNTWCWSTKTRVENWHMEQIIAAVNSGKCTIEFITQYRSCYEQMWHCVIHSKKKPYYRECQLYLPETEATFYWNDIRPDREW